MTIDPTKASTNAVNASGVTGQKSSTLGKDAFLELLVTKLKNQDPTKPEDDSAMLAQLAQFSALEQMQQMNATLTSIAGFFTDAKAAMTAATSAGASSAGDSTTDSTKKN
jgi:flagellar basal-body rod modification protein FlgD